jgi:putative oxidoreductase
MSKDLGKLILRIGVSGLMIPHGYAKLLKLIENGFEAGFADPLGIGEIPTLILAIIAELICPVLIIFGIKTRWAALLPAGTMLVAAFVIHIDDPWSKMEFPLLYLTGFLAIMLIGPGKWAVNKS